MRFISQKLQLIVGRQFIGGRRHIGDRDTAPRLANASHFPESRGWIEKMMKRISGHDQRKRTICKIEAPGVA
jgi:hypothetical protein